MENKNTSELFEMLDNLCKMLDDKKCKELINIKFEKLIILLKKRCMINKIMMIILSSTLAVSTIHSIYDEFLIKTLLLNLLSIIAIPMFVKGVTKDKIMLNQAKTQYEKFKAIQ